MSGQILVDVQGITKQFPGVTALDHVSFQIKQGEILAIIGENGAGKSTLMNILSGAYQPTKGTIQLEGQPVTFRDTYAAQKSGIAMIHQELSVAPMLSVMENILIGRLPKNKLGFVNYPQMKAHCNKLLARLDNTTIKPEQMVGELSTSERQVVEIAKALSLNPRLLIMDEPTSSLPEKETNRLLQIMKSLAKEGVSILFVSHKMDEIYQIADRITIFRDGKHVDTIENKNVDRNKVVSLMVGREFTCIYDRSRPTDLNERKNVLEVKNLSSPKLKNISFQLRQGEVLALVGLIGAGRTELFQCLFGLDSYTSGEVLVEGKAVQIRHPKDAKANRLALVPEGRKTTGIFPLMPVQENISVCVLNQCSKNKVMKPAKEMVLAKEMVHKLSIKTPSLQQSINLLSGGNQQKCIFGRWLLTAPKILLLDEPTHGIDVGTKGEIYKIIDSLAAQGVSILLASSELPEVLCLADRVLVMRQGEITADLPARGATQESLMQHAIIQSTERNDKHE